MVLLAIHTEVVCVFCLKDDWNWRAPERNRFRLIVALLQPVHHIPLVHAFHIYASICTAPTMYANVLVILHIT